MAFWKLSITSSLIYSTLFTRSNSCDGLVILLMTYGFVVNFFIFLFLIDEISVIIAGEELCAASESLPSFAGLIYLLLMLSWAAAFCPVATSFTLARGILYELLADATIRPVILLPVALIFSGLETAVVSSVPPTTLIYSVLRSEDFLSFFLIGVLIRLVDSVVLICFDGSYWLRTV